MFNILIANITWNRDGWRNTFVNPRAGHSYARKYPGHESLNFEFYKKGIDTDKYVYGYFQRKNSPTNFNKGGLILFYSRNTDLNRGQIVGVYGKAEVIEETPYPMKGFKNNRFSVNIRAEKQYSMLFPIQLEADRYKKVKRKRMVGQIGFTYSDEEVAEKILTDELIKLSNAGILKVDYKKLISIYEYYIGKEFKLPFVDEDEKEQNELVLYYKRNKSKVEIINDLKNLKPTDEEQIVVNHKTYKRDNKTVALLKLLRNSECQICGTSILKKNGTRYIEAAHIIPKYKRGRETPDNIIILCPNHHKEFDFGNTVVKNRTAEFVEFSLNGKDYKINLKVD